ncbi:MAG: sulfite exporter TauE/SafE family protein [Nocardioides sp.]
MTPIEGALVLLAGFGAGGINAVVGSGTLITFPTLLVFGVPPVVANASNTVGLVPGSISAALGYRRELAGQRARVLWLASASLIGGLIGAVLLLALPPGAFAAIVPALILLGVTLVIFQKPIARWVAARHREAEDAGEGLSSRGATWVWPGVLGAGIYGGYFGAAQGVLLMAIMGIGISDSMQRLNGVKNVLAAVVNGVAAAVFIAVAPVNWAAAGLIAVGSVIGAQVGAAFGRRLPDWVLRAVIVAVGLSALVVFVAR